MVRTLFWLKKFISFWLMPLSFTVAMMGVGLWLMRSEKRATLGRRLMLAGLLLLVVLSNKYTSRLLIRPLETQYPALPEFTAGTPPPARLAACRFVAILGGGNGHSPDMAATNLLSTSALGRVVEAARILRVLPEVKVIVSGPGGPTKPSHAVILGRAVQSFGIAADRIIYVDYAHDTEDEANAIRKIAGDAPVAVVTSAWHMPRAMALCRGAGVDALACPADFLSHADDDFYFTGLLWDVGALGVSSLGVREHIGYLWVGLRGKTGKT